MSISAFLLKELYVSFQSFVVGWGRKKMGERIRGAIIPPPKQTAT